MKEVTILIPTCNRITALVALLTSLCSQNYKNFDVVISDQNEKMNILDNPTIKTVLRLLELHGNKVTVYKHLPRRGIAEQRDFLFSKSNSPYSLFLDDDLILEPFVVGNLVKAIKEENVGFVGQAVLGLSFINDVRPNQQAIEFWEKRVGKETIRPNAKKWQRHQLHNAANLLHVQEKLELSPGHQKKYKVAWIGGCVMYDTEKVRSIGGFSFWRDLPQDHCGEEVLVQIKLMEKYGGCGVIPSGVYHQELITTLPDRTNNAPELLLRDTLE